MSRLNRAYPIVCGSGTKLVEDETVSAASLLLTLNHHILSNYPVEFARVCYNVYFCEENIITGMVHSLQSLWKDTRNIEAEFVEIKR